MKFRNLAIVCLAALLIVYCGLTLFASVCTPVNAEQSAALRLTTLSKSFGDRQWIHVLGDPIVDPRPH